MHNIYKANLIAMKVGTEYLEWGAINQGVCQECNLSPLLFVIYMNEIIRQLTAASP
jgi:hypothetical protein